MATNNYFIPVGKNKREKSISKQLAKIMTEFVEVNDAHHYYRDLLTLHMKYVPTDKVIKAKRDIAIELGDVIVASLTAMDMLGFDIRDIMREVYVKNSERGYYD